MLMTMAVAETRAVATMMAVWDGKDYDDDGEDEVDDEDDDDGGGSDGNQLIWNVVVHHLQL